MTDPDKLYYRFHEEHYANGPRVCCTQFKMIRATKHGAWIDVYGKEKFVLDGDGKRFAHATQKQALDSYLARKRRQRRINLARAADAETCIEIAELIQRSGKHIDAYTATSYEDVIDYALPE